jgi:hypothetical protein
MEVKQQEVAEVVTTDSQELEIRDLTSDEAQQVAGGSGVGGTG